MMKRQIKKDGWNAKTREERRRKNEVIGFSFPEAKPAVA
jgi:hypothetical protein